jgi:hypothetical protein
LRHHQHPAVDLGIASGDAGVEPSVIELALLSGVGVDVPAHL